MEEGDREREEWEAEGDREREELEARVRGRWDLRGRVWVWGGDGGSKKVVGLFSCAGHSTDPHAKISLCSRADLLSGPPTNIDFSMRSF